MSFTGRWEYNPGFVKNIKQEYPDFVDLAEALQEVAKKDQYKVVMRVSSYTGFVPYIADQEHVDKGYDYAFAYEKEYQQVFRDMAKKMYNGLEQEYEYQQSEETIAEAMESNGYTFLVDGTRFEE